MLQLGNYAEDAMVDFKWSTNDGDGASITRAADGTVSVYKANNVAQSVAGVTDTEDFDALTGIHHCRIDLSADAFYAMGNDYQVVLSAATIDGQTVNAVVAHFSIEARFQEVDVVKWLGTACATPTVAGVPEIDLTHIGGQAISGYNATLKLKQLDVQNSAGSALVCKSTGGNGHGFELAGNGSGEGLNALGGATGQGMSLIGGATSGRGLLVGAQNGDEAGAYFYGEGSGPGLHVGGGLTGNGLQAEGGGTSGAGISATALGGNDNGIEAVKSGTGYDIDADIHGTIDTATDVTNRVTADMTYIHGSALTETAGQLAGRFVDFFDQDSAGYNVKTALSSFKATGFSTHDAAAVKTAIEADGSKLDHLWEMTEDDGGVRRYTTNSLEQAPGGGGDVTVGDLTAAALAKFSTTDTGETTPVSGSVAKLAQGEASGLTAAAVADAVHDEALSGHTSSGSAGEALGRLGDVQAKTDLLGTGQVTVSSPVDPVTWNIRLTQGDDYDDDEGRSLEWTNENGTWGDGDITSNTVSFKVTNKKTGQAAISKAGSVVTPTGTQKIRVELTAAETAALTEAGDAYKYQIRIVEENNHIETRIEGNVFVTTSLFA